MQFALQLGFSFNGIFSTGADRVLYEVACAPRGNCGSAASPSSSAPAQVIGVGGALGKIMPAVGFDVGAAGIAVALKL